MVKSISTNFSLRVNNKNQPKVVADSRISSGLTGQHFYTITYTVDVVGIFLGTIHDFLGIQPKSPILIDFQRPDMHEPNHIYCSKLFINHGDMGKVWLRSQDKPVIVTVWYSADDEYMDKQYFVDIHDKDKRIKIKELALKNMDGVDFSVPVKHGAKYRGLRKTKVPINGIPVTTHRGDSKLLVVNSK